MISVRAEKGKKQVLPGKEREIQQRRDHFIEAAREVLLEDGYQAVSIGRVAEYTGFSRGTVYQLFSSKEELVVALGMKCRERLYEVVSLGYQFPGLPREKMVAVAQAVANYATESPGDQRILKIIDSELILEKVAERQQNQMVGYDVRIFGIVRDIVDQGLKSGDLVLPANSTGEGLCLGLWCLVDGTFAAQIGGAPLGEIGIADPMAEMLQNGHMLLDGYQYRPLSSEHDYETTLQRFQQYFTRKVAEAKGEVA